MGSDKIHRLLRLITLLQSSRARSAQDLMAELKVSRRTLFRDLSMLQAAGIPWYYDPKQGYQIASNHFLPPVALTVSETLSLMLLAKTAMTQRNRPMVDTALQAINKLVSNVPSAMRQACTELMSRVSVDPGGQVDGTIESRHYGLLQTCIDQGRRCRMVYRSPVEKELLRLTLDPYLLHFGVRAWYVFGQSDLHDEVRMFKLARIQSLEETRETFVRPKRFKAADRLGQAWQMNPEGKVHHVELEFAPLVAMNVSEVHWHATQKHTLLPDGRCRMSFDVDGLKEIAWWICGYADQVKVLQPAALARLVAEMHQRAIG